MNQKAVLSKYAADDGFSSPVFFIGDGISGVTFDRPNFNRMTAEIEAGNVATVIVKDMPRLRRDYLRVGYYTEVFLMKRGMCYIAINDDVGNAKGDNDFTPSRNLSSDFYAEDTSKKVRAIKQAQGMAGEHLTKSLYDYIVNPTNKKQWIVDEEAVAVVKRILDLCISGKGSMQIAEILKADNMPIAKAYYAKEKRRALPGSPYNWKGSSIVGILERMDYCGHMVNLKSYSKSHKLKKQIPTTREQQAVFYNAHEVIVEGAIFERVQELRTSKRRPTKAERQDLFSSSVYRADCGSKLHLATCRSFNGSQDHYHCAKYRNGAGSCTAHFIREEVLEQIVWGRIFDVTAFFFDDIMAFREMTYQQRSIETGEGMRCKEREVGQAQKRVVELGRTFKRIYEDDTRGAISHERFLKLSAEYEAGQREMEERVKSEQQEVDTYEQNGSGFDSFSAIIRKYVGIREFTPTVVNESIKKVIVHVPGKVDGERIQEVDIVFSFVGEINFLSTTPPKCQGAQERGKTVQPLQSGLYRLV